MRTFRSILVAALSCWCVISSLHADGNQRYVGGDISLLPQYEKHNSSYKDAYGKKIDDLIPWLISECGWNTFRVRIFVNPQQKAPKGETDLAVCQDLAYVTALGKRIKAAGAFFLLDFHYSDTWVDATHIQAPAAWKGASDGAMADSIMVYTEKVLRTLKAENATPDLVQVGNEIMYGLCDIVVAPYEKSGLNWNGYLGLLKAGCNTVREECPNAKIIIHTDRPNNTGYNKYYYQKLIDGGVDYDIIGLSYYPFWHGYLTEAQTDGKSDKNYLVKSINQLATDFPDKRVHIVECAYNFQDWPSKGVNYDTRDIWPCSKQGQYNFVRDLVDELKPLTNVDGINYWFPEEAGNGDDSDWSTGGKGATVMGAWLSRGFWSVSPSSSGHAINRTSAPSDTNPAYNVCAPYYMRAFIEDLPGQGIETVEQDAVRGEKTIENGQLIIHRGDRRFTVLGQEL